MSDLAADNAKRLPSQIAQKARDRGNGAFSGIFENAYSMTFVVFSIGDTTIGGSYSGTCSEQNGIVSFSGTLDFYLRDAFADPLDIGVEVIDLQETIDENLHKPAESRIRRRIDWLIQDRLRQQKQDRLGIHTGKPYPITDAWTGAFLGRVYSDLERSVYIPER